MQEFGVPYTCAEPRRLCSLSLVSGLRLEYRRSRQLFRPLLGGMGRGLGTHRGRPLLHALFPGLSQSSDSHLPKGRGVRRATVTRPVCRRSRREETLGSQIRASSWPVCQARVCVPCGASVLFVCAVSYSRAARVTLVVGAQDPGGTTCADSESRLVECCAWGNCFLLIRNLIN